MAVVSPLVIGFLLLVVAVIALVVTLVVVSARKKPDPPRSRGRAPHGQQPGSGSGPRGPE
ncbi:hypothetical protein ACWFMI_18185 [Nocardiopsis terrae]